MKSSAMCRLCPALGDRDEIRSLAKSKPGGKLAHPRAAAREQCPTQEVHLAAAERGERIRRLRAGEPLRVVAPAVDERVHVAEPAAAFPDPENEVVVLGPALIAVGDELGPGSQARAGQWALNPEIVLHGLDGDE